MSAAAILYSFTQNLFKYGGSIIVVVGTVGCILNLMVFTQSTLRKNPCGIYFTAVNSINLASLYVGLLLLILDSGYNINLFETNLFVCRFRYYFGFVLACWESSCLILASIDRTFITSRNAATRKHGTRRLSIICIVFVCLFWAIVHIHALIHMIIRQFGPNYFLCYYESGMYTTFVTYYSVLINGVFPPTLMLIFGFWTVKNVRAIGHATLSSVASRSAVVSVGRPQILQSKDQQLIRMLLVEITTYILCKTPVLVFYIYQEITRYNVKSVEQGLIEQCVLLLTYFYILSTTVLVSMQIYRYQKRFAQN
ncbi:unnamed protein product [Adineta ricciae]|uniref:G-protein coupled receptors family 1 profile domain-containing protein n=1 Tax=Adineta ricciae TaxID=249248 RepID=A0A815WXQ9_ADIRI|nr:unnamed protein product [Adineta ricciae]CAF1669721.1 unnamed protein product [Adineta ricciae]